MQVLSPFQAILDYELGLGVPPGWVNYSIDKTAPDGFWHRLETGSMPMDSGFFAGFNKDLHDPARWEAFYRSRQAKDPSLPRQVPPLPRLDGERLFLHMMSGSRAPDPWMWPALQKLQASGRYIIAALSNTVIFPKGYDLAAENFFDDPTRSIFDVFISSAHVGLRKPNPEIYKLALQKANEFAKAHAHTPRGTAGRWAVEDIKAQEVLFLDDIGENLKAAKKVGFHTLRVFLGRAFEAVDQLEEMTGLQLAGDHPRIAIKPRITSSATKAKV